MTQRGVVEEGTGGAPGLPGGPRIVANHLRHLRAVSDAAGPAHPTGATTPTSAQDTPQPGILFGAAHGTVSSPRAPSASDAIATWSRNATRRQGGTEELRAAPGTQRGESATQTAPSSAWSGRSPRVAPPKCTTANTNAPDVAQHLTELKGVLSRRASRAHTPLQPDSWNSQLRMLGLDDTYPFISNSIRYGFDAGIRPITVTFAPPNSASLIAFAVAFQEIIDNEFSKGRYIGPLSRKDVEWLIGPFQSSPISLVPKPHKTNKFRLVQNLSFPHTPSETTSSINFSIDSDHFPCLWGTFPIVANIIRSLPPSSQAAIRDVSEAYRIAGLAPDQWPGTVVRLPGPDSFAINTSNLFGLSSAAGVYGSLADCGVDIMRGGGIGPISKWVDDHAFFRMLREHVTEFNRRRHQTRLRIEANGGRRQSGGRYWFDAGKMPSGRTEEHDDSMRFPVCDLSGQSPRSSNDVRFSYCMADIDAVSDPLGIPWEKSKDIDFASEFPFTGLVWNIATRSVSLSEEKKSRYLDAIQTWLEARSHTLPEVQKLYGKLLHAALVVPAGRAYLTRLERMLGVFNRSPHQPHTAPKGTSDDLRWWRETLTRPVLMRAIPGPVPILDVCAFSDASSKVGIGIVIRGHWRAWRLLPGWEKEGRGIAWAESVGFELLIRSLLRDGAPAPNILVQGDNSGVVEGWWNHRSRDSNVNSVFRRIHSFLLNAHCTIHSRYISTHSNPADDPSRGIYPAHSLLLPPVALPHELAPFIVDFDAPHRESELGSRRLFPAPRRIIDAASASSQLAVNDAFAARGAILAADDTLRWD